MLAPPLIGSLCFGVLIVAAQLPPSATLSDDDRAQLRATLDQLKKLLPAAPDRNPVTYEIARTWPAGKQWPEAIEWLDKVGALKSGLDPSRRLDIYRASRFTRVRCDHGGCSRCYSTGLAWHAGVPSPRGRSHPESLAYGPKTKRSMRGNVKKKYFCNELSPAKFAAFSPDSR
jgi:hypothetical protein